MPRPSAWRSSPADKAVQTTAPGAKPPERLKAMAADKPSPTAGRPRPRTRGVQMGHRVQLTSRMAHRHLHDRQKMMVQSGAKTARRRRAAGPLRRRPDRTAQADCQMMAKAHHRHHRRPSGRTAALAIMTVAMAMAHRRRPDTVARLLPGTGLLPLQKASVPSMVRRRLPKIGAVAPPWIYLTPRFTA